MCLSREYCVDNCSVWKSAVRTIESSLHEIIGRRPGVPPRHASPHRPRSQRRQNIRGVSTFLQQSKMWAKLKENEELMGNCWSKQRKRTNLSENEEMVRKICRVLCVDVNLSSRLLHCCPFTLCVYIAGDFPQIHCGYNKKVFMYRQSHRIFVALICIFTRKSLKTFFSANNWSCNTDVALHIVSAVAAGLLFFCICAFMYFLYLYIFVFATTRLYWLAHSPQLNVHHRGDDYIFNDEDVDEEQVRVRGCSSIFAGSTPAAC